MFIFSIFVPPDKNQQKYAETATCFRSLGENSPEDPAQVKERPTWRSIAKSRALYDQMAPQLCLFYISAKFDVRPTKPNPILDLSFLRFIVLASESMPIS